MRVSLPLPLPTLSKISQSILQTKTHQISCVKYRNRAVNINISLLLRLLKTQRIWITRSSPEASGRQKRPDRCVSVKADTRVVTPVSHCWARRDVMLCSGGLGQARMMRERIPRYVRGTEGPEGSPPPCPRSVRHDEKASDLAWTCPRCTGQLRLCVEGLSHQELPWR